MLQKTIEEQRQTAMTDLSSLSRVSHRLALVDTSIKLQTVLDKLLPRLLQRIGDNHQQQLQLSQHGDDEAQLMDTLSKIHLKLIEMLSHVMKRVRDDHHCKLNANGILALLLNSNVITEKDDEEQSHVVIPCTLTAKECDSFSLNLSLAFLTLAIPRSSATELETLLPGLLVLLAFYEGKVEHESRSRSGSSQSNNGNNESQSSSSSSSSSTVKKQWHQISHLLLRTMERIIVEEEIDMKRRRKGTTSSRSTNHNDNDKQNKRIKTEENQEENDKSVSPPMTATAFAALSGLEQARDVLMQDDDIAAAAFDLLLDVFLYETQVGNVPPAGLSTMGWDRLKSGHSSTERDWEAEMAPTNRLATFKSRLVEWVAPHRRWGLFLGNQRNDDDDDVEINDKNKKVASKLLGKSRSLVLLVMASGDPMQSVSETAKQYLKQYYDSKKSNSDDVFGNADRMYTELLGLSAGGMNAEALLAAEQNATSKRSAYRMGYSHLHVASRRRQISDFYYCEATETATKAMQDATDTAILDTGKLSLLSCDKMLSKLTNAMGLNNVRGRPFLLAADHVQHLLLRLNVLKNVDSTLPVVLQAQALTLATQVLLPIAATKVTSSSNSMSESSVAVRDSMYSVISIVARSNFATEKYHCLMAGGKLEQKSLSTDLVQLLLRCVSNEIDKLRPRVTAALDALLFACRREVQKQFEETQDNILVSNPWMNSAGLDNAMLSPAVADEHCNAMFPLLWSASKYTQSKQARVVAARWASDLLVGLDLTKATHLLCFLSGDPDVTVSAIALEGLGLTKEKDVENAGFGELCEVLFSSVDHSSRPTFWEFSAKGKISAIKCVLKTFLVDFHCDEADLTLLMEALTISLLDGNLKDLDLIDCCCETLATCLGLSSSARSLIASSHFGLGYMEMKHIIFSSGSAHARRFLADAFGCLMADSSNFEAGQWAQIISEFMYAAVDVLNGQQLKSSAAVHGATLSGGACIKLLHHDMTIEWGDSMAAAARVLDCLGDGLLNPDDTVGSFCSDGILLSCSRYGALTLHGSLVAPMAALLSKLNESLFRFGNGDRANAARVMKILEAGGPAMALAHPALMHDISSPLKDCVTATIKLLGSESFRKDEIVSLCAGEALASFACAYDTTTKSPVKKSAEWPTEMNEIFARSLIPPEQVLYSLLRMSKTTNSNHQRRACASALLAIVARGAGMKKSIPLRLSLQSKLEEIQDCFLFLLIDGKSSQLSRESCCLGLIALHNLVESPEKERELQDHLLRGFGQTTNFGGSAMQETASQAAERRRTERESNEPLQQTAGGSDVEVGGVAGLSEASLGAYVEMASAAVACGQPHLVYSMLLLSVSHAAWSEEKRRDMYGPAALHKSEFNSDEVKVALRPHLARLLPRTLRACHDPNQQTREQMETLWVGLTGGGEEGRVAISRFLRPTIDALVEETSSKLWRTRAGACGALAQVIVGRTWLDLGGGEAVLDENYDLVISKTACETTFAGVRLLRLWRCCLRALDDVRIPVRESGEALGRGLRALTIRLCNPDQNLEDGNDGNTADLERNATAAAATALRFLLKSGLKQQCAEAAGICISTLIGIIDICAKPAIFEALLSDVIYALLVALSNLEPAALSYLSVRQEAGSVEYEDLAKLRLSAAQSSPLASAVRKCIDMIPFLTSHRHQQAVVGAIEAAIRKSTGIATRSACADCVITLCHTTPWMFRSNPSANALLRCFFEGIFKERGGRAAQNKINAAFGSLAALCSGAEVRKITIICSERYTASHGNNDDPDSRHAAALSLRSIAVKAPSQISQQPELWRNKVLPISFLGMTEPDNPDVTLWKEIWEEGGAAIDFALDDRDANTIEEKLLLNLVNACVEALADVSWHRRKTGALALSDLADRCILSPPASQMDKPPSPQIQRRAKRRARACTLALSSLVELVSRSRVWSGKGEVVTAMTKAAIPWIRYIDPNESLKLFGEDFTGPLVGAQSSAAFDLFQGDRWFERSSDGEVGSTMSEGDSSMLPYDDGTLLEREDAVSVVGLIRLLLLQSFPSKVAIRSVTSEEILPFRSSVLQSLDDVLRSLQDMKPICSDLHRDSMVISAPTLYNVFGDLSTEEQPLIVARSISCFASALPSNMAFVSATDEKYMDSVNLTTLFLHHVDYSKQAAWTVREAAAKCVVKLVQSADVETIRRGHFLSSIIQIATVALKDRKFWKVRYASLLLLQSIVERKSGGSCKFGDIEEGGLIVEAILPFKESIHDLCRKSLNDAEAEVTSLATKILGGLSLWP